MPPSSSISTAYGYSMFSASLNDDVVNAPANSSFTEQTQLRYGTHVSICFPEQNGAPAGVAQQENAGNVFSASNAVSQDVPVSFAGLKSVTLMHALMTPTNGQQRQQPVPEFLYQLTRMLLEGPSRAIEWNSGKIFVHDPYKLESDVLKNYFRHSRFSSFQRQLNYFVSGLAMRWMECAARCASRRLTLFFF